MKSCGRVTAETPTAALGSGPGNSSTAQNPAAPSTPALLGFRLPRSHSVPGYLGAQRCGGGRNTLLATKTHLQKLERVSIIFPLSSSRGRATFGRRPCPPHWAELRSQAGKSSLEPGAGLCQALGISS